MSSTITATAWAGLISFDHGIWLSHGTKAIAANSHPPASNANRVERRRIESRRIATATIPSKTRGGVSNSLMELVSGETIVKAVSENTRPCQAQDVRRTTAIT